MNKDIDKEMARRKRNRKKLDEKRKTDRAEKKRRESLTAFVGRAKKMTDNVIEDLYRWLQMGLDVKDACAKVGISKQAYYQRREKDETFAMNCDKRRANLVSKCAIVVNEALDSGRCDPELAFKIWAKARPDQFSDATKVHVNGEVRSLPFGSIEPISDEIRGKLGLGGMDVDAGVGETED